MLNIVKVPQPIRCFIFSAWAETPTGPLGAHAVSLNLPWLRVVVQPVATTAIAARSDVSCFVSFICIYLSLYGCRCCCCGFDCKSTFTCFRCAAFAGRLPASTPYRGKQGERLQGISRGVEWWGRREREKRRKEIPIPGLCSGRCPCARVAGHSHGTN